MCKFIRIKNFAELKKIKNYPAYIRIIKTLYENYSKFLFDDFSPFKNSGVSDFIQAVSPYFWIILERKTSGFAGFAYLDNFTGNENFLYSAEISICFTKGYRGAFVRYCAKIFFKMCFDIFGFQKIKAQYYPQNFTVKKLLADCGFKYESRLIRETLQGGKPQDIAVCSLYREYYYNNEV